MKKKYMQPVAELVSFKTEAIMTDEDTGLGDTEEGYESGPDGW